MNCERKAPVRYTELFSRGCTVHIQYICLDISALIWQLHWGKTCISPVISSCSVGSCRYVHLFCGEVYHRNKCWKEACVMKRSSDDALPSSLRRHNRSGQAYEAAVSSEWVGLLQLRRDENIILSKSKTMWAITCSTATINNHQAHTSHWAQLQHRRHGSQQVTVSYCKSIFYVKEKMSEWKHWTG